MVETLRWWQRQADWGADRWELAERERTMCSEEITLVKKQVGKPVVARWARVASAGVIVRDRVGCGGAQRACGLMAPRPPAMLMLVLCVIEWLLSQEG